MLRNDDELQGKLNQLKRSYDRMPPFSQTEKIVEHIQRAAVRRERKNVRKWLPFSATAAALVLIALLVLASPGLFDRMQTEYAEDHSMNQADRNEPETNILVEENDEQDQPATNPAKDRPKTKVDQLLIEGMPEEKTFTLVVHDTLRFSTYYPEDMVVESTENSVTIYANFGGEKNDQAFLQFYGIQARERDVIEAAEATLNANFHGYAVTEKERSEFAIPYSEREFLVTRARMAGTVSFFTRNGYLYVVTIHYPVEMGDGFAARVDKILDDIQWYDQ